MRAYQIMMFKNIIRFGCSFLLYKSDFINRRFEMMKKGNILVCLITVLAVLAGCGKDSPKEFGIGKEQGKVIQTEKEQKTTDSQQENGELRMLTDDTLHASYGTEQGWYYFNDQYEIEDDDDRLPAIMYVDYQTGRGMYLCNKLNCKHNSYDCNAVLPKEIEDEKVLFGQGEYLYIATSDYDSSGSMSSGQMFIGEGEDGEIQSFEKEPCIPAIYRMKLDGTEREKVMDLESGTVLEGVFLGDGDNLYAIRKKVKSESKGANTYDTGYDKFLVKVDLKNKKIEKVLELDEEEEILGCAGRNIVTGTRDYGKKVTTEEKHSDDDLYKQADYVIKSIDLDSKESVALKTLKEKNIHQEKVKGIYIYISKDKSNKIEVINFLTKETKIIKTAAPLSVDAVIQDKQGTDILYCVGYDSYGNDEKGWDYYLVNTKTGKIIDGKLKNDENTPVDIVAQTSEKLLVNSNYKNVTEYVPWVGVNQTVIGEMEYSLISKDDYINNKANYKKIKMIGMSNTNNKKEVK